MGGSVGNIAGKIVLIVFAGIDVILFLIPLLMTVSRKNKLSNYTLTVEATVVEMNTHSINRLSDHYTSVTPMWFPVYQYTIDGQVFTHPSNVGTTKKHYEVGDRLKVRVDPADHSKYILAESPGFKLATGILWAIAIFFTAATIIVGVLL